MRPLNNKLYGLPLGYNSGSCYNNHVDYIYGDTIRDLA